MSARTKIHRNTRLSPKSSVRERVPKVAILEPLTARRPEQSGLILRSAGDGRITLTSAPVSTKKRRPEYLSVKNSRRLGEWPVTLVAESVWPNRFPPSGTEVYISSHGLRTCDGTSTGRHQNLWRSTLRRCRGRGYANTIVWTDYNGLGHLTGELVQSLGEVCHLSC